MSKCLYWFFSIAVCLIIGLLIAILVLVAIDFSRDNNNNNDNFPNIPKTLRFNNGIEFPVLGMGSGYTSSDDAYRAVLAGIDRGYRHVDTAYIYQNEVGVGAAVNQKIAEGVIRREEMFIVSKVWSTFMAPTAVRGALMDTLGRLNFTYVDLYLIHWPMNEPETTDFTFVDTWRVMEDLVDEGLIRSIGVSNFNDTQLDRILENARIKPVTNQIESHPHCLNTRLIEYCKSKDVSITTYSPLGAPNHPQFTPESRLAINEPHIRQVAIRHQRTPAQVMLRYQLQRGHIVITRSNRFDRITSNYNVFDFHLSDDDIRLIESVGYELRISNVYGNPNHHEFPWDQSIPRCL